MKGPKSFGRPQNYSEDIDIQHSINIRKKQITEEIPGLNIPLPKKARINSSTAYSGFGPQPRDSESDEDMIPDGQMKFNLQRQTPKIDFDPKIPKVYKESSSSDDDAEIQRQLNIMSNPQVSVDKNQFQKPESQNLLHSKENYEQEENEKDENSDDEINHLLELGFPVSHEFLVHGNPKTVPAFAIDKSGARMVTGCLDFFIRYWDFHGMSRCTKWFMETEGPPSQTVRRVIFNSSSDELLFIPQNAMAKVNDRDGRELAETVRGDMYIRDLSHTKGHTADIMDGCFHPTEPGSFITCSLDSTIRIWDRKRRLFGIEQQIACNSVIKVTDKRGQREKVSSVEFNSTGSTIYASSYDGSLQTFDLRQFHYRASSRIEGAFLPNIETFQLKLFGNDRKLASRGVDHSLKIWDLRMSKKPLESIFNIPSNWPNARFTLSPDEKYFAVAFSASAEESEDESKNGGVLFIDSTTFEKVASLSIGPYSATDITWHPVLNQIFVGSTDHTVHIFYNPKLSTKGALYFAAKAPKRWQPEDIKYFKPAFTPHALPMFKDTWGRGKRNPEKIRKDPNLTKIPVTPMYGPGRRGKISGANTLTQHVMRSIFQKVDEVEDARTALLKLAESEKDNQHWVNEAYKQTQPEAIFDLQAVHYDEEELLSKYNAICSKCGLKICRCRRIPTSWD